MRPFIRPISALLALAALSGGLRAAPVPSSSTETVNDRKAFIPYRKHAPLAEKVIGVLVADAGPVLQTEGRTGPADQLCFGRGGNSYRWVYVPADKDPTIGRV